MNAVKSMILDLKCSKVYWRNMLFALIIVAFLLIQSDTMIFFVIMMLYMLLLPLWQYPFATYDKCSMMYLSLPQKKTDIVLGRFLLAGLGIIAAMVLSLIILAAERPSGIGFKASFCIVSLLSMFIALLMSIQAPILFRFGYMKSRIFVVISIAVIPALVGALVPIAFNSKSSKKTVMDFLGNGMSQTSPLVSVTLLLASAVFLAISYVLSVGIFSKKDV